MGATTSTYAAPTVTNTLLRSFSSTPIAAKKPTIRELTPPLARYTDEELSILKEKYTPEQLQSLLMGEETINHEDFLARKGRAPKDPYKLRYLTDLSKMDPVWDFPPPEVLAEDPHATQPLPKTEFDQNKYFPMEEAGEGELDYKELAKQTGFPERTLKGLYLKKLDMHRVVNQTRLGKIRKMYCLFVAGNENGMVGIGEGKSSEPEDATRMATRNAIKNMMPIQRYQGRTVHGDMDVKIGAVEMKIMARPQGISPPLSLVGASLVGFEGQLLTTTLLQVSESDAQRESGKSAEPPASRISPSRSPEAETQ